MNTLSAKQFCLVAAIHLVMLGASNVASAQDDSRSGDAPAALEEITVFGVRSSLERSREDKRLAAEIKDSISAEDIGQLPDDNIAEALQRITGVQMARSADGEGSTIQIRGISDNNVQLNGQTVSGSAADRSIDFQDIPSELFSGIEVLKAPTAGSIEGSLGGTVNLKTRRPLTGKKDLVASITGQYKYADIADEYDPSVNAFLLKQWRDTSAGDFGVILNVGARSITTVSEAYGAGDFEGAPAVWVRRTGADTARNPFLAAGPWQYDANVDVNGDGVSDANDIFYIPSGFGYFENTREEDRNSFNGTFQWQPNEKVNLYFDATLTDIESEVTGSRYSLNFNTVRSAPLASGNNVYEQLADTGGLGPVYRMTSGRIGAITTRMGASPSVNMVERDSQQFALGGDWQISDRFNLSAEASVSDGERHTVEQGALIMGMDWDGNGALNAGDFAGILDFDLSASTVPNVTFYESPFPAPNFGVTSVQTALTAISPSDVNYERLAYFQFNRVSSDTQNSADAVRLDGTLDFNDTGFTQLKFGVRVAERVFERAGHQNGNQRGNWPSILDVDGTNPTERINVQSILVNPASNTDADIAASSTFLQACHSPGGYSGLLSSEGGDLPTTWTSTAGCSVSDLTAAFSLFDIRAINPANGVGYYERTGLRYAVAEDTDAAYIRADFRAGLGNTELYGNIGGRYIRTELSSAGWAQRADGTFELVSFNGEYNDFLPSLNANLALTDEIILRLGLSQSIARPGLDQLSPGLGLSRNNQISGVDGNGTAGNPDLDPVRSDNIDLSFEWYYGEANLLSIAYYHKDIDSTIFLSNEQVPLQIGDEVFLVRTFENFPGTKIDGFEFGLLHAFNALPGLLSNTGIVLNYTITDEDSDLVDQEGDPIPRRRLSQDSYNAIVYYDDGRLNLRLAYNWRDEFVRFENVTLGFGSPNVLPEFVADRGQLDLSANYSFTDNLKVNFSAVNINDSKTERYMKYAVLTNYIAFAGPRYNLGFVYRF